MTDIVFSDKDGVVGKVDISGPSPKPDDSVADIVASWRRRTKIPNSAGFAKDFDGWTNGYIVAKSDISKGTNSLDRSPRKNWVERGGGLPAYIDKIANDLHTERGMPISRAIAVAISRCKLWAAGGDGIKPDTQVKAAKAIAEWEKMKAKAHLSKRDETGTTAHTLTP